LPFASSAPRFVVAEDVLPAARAIAKAGTPVGGAAESDAVTAPLPATVIEAVSPFADAATGAPADVSAVSGDALAPATAPALDVGVG
jgi:hypothetical protein